METIVVILGIVLIVLIIFNSFSKRKKEIREKKSYYLKRFLRNREQALAHIGAVELIIQENDVLNEKAFPNKEITFSEYLKALKQDFNSDYSESSYQTLKRNKLSTAEKQEYTKKLIDQSEDLYLMEVDMGILNKIWKSQELV